MNPQLIELFSLLVAQDQAHSIFKLAAANAGYAYPNQYLKRCDAAIDRNYFSAEVLRVFLNVMIGQRITLLRDELQEMVDDYDDPIVENDCIDDYGTY